ncbi:MAG: MAC/perforin domain-containing protein [Candidatus Rokuibacteriota bacterium]
MKTTSGSDIKALSDYGILGYGIDIVHNEPLSLVAGFTYDRQQTFEFDRPILIPDQFTIDPTPVHKMTELRYSGIMTTARDYQRNLVNKVGLGGTVNGVEFSGNAEVVNQLFSGESEASVRQYIDISGDYIILRINGSRLADALLPEVSAAARTAATSVDGARAFYQTYGTHVVKEASIGGQMSVTTELTLTSSACKSIVENGVKVDAEAKVEAAAYVSRKISFDVRSADTSKDFRSNSSVTVNLTGGNIAAPDTNAWRDSLNHSELPTRSDVSSHPGVLTAGPHFYLGLVGVKYLPVYKILNLNPAQEAVFEQALQQHLGGIDPFQESPRRFKPNVPDSVKITVGKSHRFQMRGWMATYETYAGLEAKPGAYAVVQCKSDAEPGGWTEAKVYAGETAMLRGKTPYLSAYMDVKVSLVNGDDGATVYARNKLVSW